MYFKLILFEYSNVWFSKNDCTKCLCNQRHSKVIAHNEYLMEYNSNSIMFFDLLLNFVSLWTYQNKIANCFVSQFKKLMIQYQKHISHQMIYSNTILSHSSAAAKQHWFLDQIITNWFLEAFYHETSKIIESYPNQ